jgi:F-type H+-transporting ATPase subunit delta
VEANSSSVRTFSQDFVRSRWLTWHTIVSGGFAVVQPDSQLSINAVEGYALEDFSDEAVKSQISEASKIANGSGSEQDIAEAKIELEVSG